MALRLDAERCENNPQAQKLDEDSIAICTLLHDLCDCSGLSEIVGHGRRSVKMLKELGLKLTQEEFLAIRFHMSLKDKEGHPLYDDAKRSQLRYIVHKADGMSAKLCSGFDKPSEHTTSYYLQNITKLDCKDIIFQVKDGWFMNPHSPYDGEIDPEWKDKIIDIKKFDTAKLYPINNSFTGAIFILGSGNKKGLFVLHHCFGMQGGTYFSPDDEPFMYSDVKVYSDWDNWSSFEGNSDNWSSYGYAVCKQQNCWKLVKITQFPMYNYEVVGEGFASAEKAMESIGIDDSDKHLTKGINR